MNEFPTEILQHIFQYISQRNLVQCSIVCKKWHQIIFQPRFYFTTIELYSYQQLKKYIKIATKKVISIQDNDNDNDNLPMIYYTQHLNIYFDIIIFYDAILDFISVFPNLSTINAFGKDIISGRCIKKTIPQLEQLISIPFWYRCINKEYINNLPQQESKLKTLCHAIQQQQFRQLDDDDDDDEKECIYLKRTGPIQPGKHGLNYFLYTDYEDDDIVHIYRNKILILPTFESLTSLNLSFIHCQTESSINEYDERIIESIHQSCPQLEKLQLDYFYMNISDVFHARMISNSNNNNQYVTSGLKEFKVDGALRDPRCFIYLSLKYSQLTSFTLICNHIDFLGDDLQAYQLPIYEMITHYYSSSLKQFTIDFATGLYPNINNEGDVTFWPKHDFIRWLNDHPEQLTHLSYPDSLYPVEWNNPDDDSDDNVDDNDSDDDEWLEKSWKNLNDSIMMMTTTMEKMNLQSISSFHKNKILHGGTFLNYLTSLTLRFEHIVDTVTTYLLLHDYHTITISNTIKELKIHSATPQHYFYFYDWLDLFPNLMTFHVKRVEFLIFDTVEDNYILFDHDNEKNGNYLHYLIKQRKSQLNGIHNNNNNNNNNDDDVDNNNVYKLKKLILEGVGFRLKNGFDAIFKKLIHINSLTLSWIYYSPPGWNSIENDPLPTLKNIYFNLPHSYLDYLSIFQFRIVPWDNPYAHKCFLLDKLIVNESLSHKEYTVHVKNTTNRDFWDPIDGYQYTLHLASKYVDKLIF